MRSWFTQVRAQQRALAEQTPIPQERSASSALQSIRFPSRSRSGGRMLSARRTSSRRLRVRVLA
jgi:hypothetical protein